MCLRVLGAAFSWVCVQSLHPKGSKDPTKRYFGYGYVVVLG